MMYTISPRFDVDYYLHSRFRSKGRYRAYEKAHYGNYFSASHVLDIERVTAADLGTYKVEVFNYETKVANDAVIELRHEGEKSFD